MSLTPLIGLCAALLTLGGTGLLHASWRSLIRENRKLLVFSGWLMLLLALVLWIEATGPEFGTVLGLSVPALAAWILVTTTADTSKRTAQRRPRNDDGGNSVLDSTGTRWSRHLLLFVLTVLLAAIASTLLTAAIADLLPWSELNRTVFVGFVMPCVWGLLAYWICATQRLQRTLLINAVVSVAAALLLFL